MSRKASSHGESGFALLFVFFMAAAIAISFYIQLPVAVFENQRIREQALLDRGQQYQRGIQLYFRKFKRYPAELKALENTNNIRFIRRLYKDPLTGSDEWRLIHISPAGVLTDSLVQKPGEKEGESKGQNTFITEGPSVGAPVESQASTSAPWMRRRGGVAGGPGAPGAGVSGDVAGPENTAQPGAEDQPAEPEGESGDQQAEAQSEQQAQSPEGFAPGAPRASQATSQPGVVYPQQTVPGQNPPIPGQQSQTQQPGATPFPFLPQPGGQQQTGGFQPGALGQPPFQQQLSPRPAGLPVQRLPGAPAPYSQPIQNQPGAQSGSPPPFIGGPPTPSPSDAGGPPPFIGGPPAPPSTVGGLVGGGPAFGGQPVGGSQSTGQPGQNPAADLIRKLLTTPNPRGLAGTQQQGLGGQPALGGQGIGGGIAGVASKKESDSIKVYNERQKYQEWEFIYDYRQDRMNMGLPGTGGLQGGTGQRNQQGARPLGPGLGPVTQPGPLTPGPSGRGR